LPAGPKKSDLASPVGEKGLSGGLAARPTGRLSPRKFLLAIVAAEARESISWRL
jgi:hypothetical protein